MENFVVPPVLQVVFDKLAIPLMEVFRNIWDRSDNLEKLKRTLLYVQAIIEDAEERKVTDADVRAWLSELKDVVYNAEDLLDEIDDKLSGAKLDLIKMQYANRVREMFSKLQTCRDEGSKFNLKERRRPVSSKKETSSFVIESEVYGREKDVDSIVDVLLNCEATATHGGGGEALCIPIIGLGGLGKTTLAQLAFNDERVTHQFDIKTWVFVYDHYDAKDILVAVIRSISNDTCLCSSMEVLYSKVWDLLHKKKYLIVLDDVWIEDQDEWERLRPLFRGVIVGSKIIITTRSKRVAMMMNCPTSPYYLQGLSDDACWSLFMQRAFLPGEREEHPDLLPIGREIVKKCGGVALAAKTLGSLMRLKREKREWLAVQNSEIWNLGECESGILPALKLSYYHLPPHLKRCFSFCSIIPRRYEIKKEKLIHLWMAGGLINQPSRKRGSPEDMGNDYFNNLLWMSFFEEVKHCDHSGGGGVGYRMHDLIYDLAKSVAVGTEFTIVHSNLPHRSCLRVRHSSVVCEFGSSVIPEMLYEAKHLRTLLLFSEGNFKHVHRGSFSSFKYLRALNLSGCGVVVLEDELIGELLFLRYLDVSHTHIRSLPRSIEHLRYLQTLNLSNCHDLQVLPNLANMLSLRHLNNTGCESLTTMLPLHEPFNQLQQLPAEITREYKALVNTALPKSQNQLQTLPLFVVAGLPDLMLLQRLNLHGSLKITRLGTVDILQIIYLTDCVTVDDAGIQLTDSSYSILKEMKYIESLGLFWGTDDPEDQENVFATFQERKPNPSYRPASMSPIGQSYIFLFLQPHQNLRRLLVEGYPGSTFPDWTSLINLTSVQLIDCRNCIRLPPLGDLKLLNSILLQGMNEVRCIGKEFYGESTSTSSRPFPALRQLALIDFPNLEEWLDPHGGDAFPSLTKLIVSKCPKLMVTPKMLSIQHLELRDCAATLVHSFQNLITLTFLVIEKVGDLSSFPGAFPGNNPLLTSLEIKSCPQLCSLSTFESLTVLKSLAIRWCENLTYLPSGLQNLNALESFEISDCHRLIFLPEIGTSGFCRLRTLSIENCSDMTSLSMGLKNLTCLEHLIIMYCPSLVTLPQRLQHLVALQSLTIFGCSPEFMFLPEELQNLKGLHGLEIRSCPGLKALPEWIHKLISLRSLAISDCHKVAFLPEGIKCLTLLQHLSIQDCPQLLRRCRKESGEDWPKIAHIPYKNIGLPTVKNSSEAGSSSN